MPPATTNGNKKKNTDKSAYNFRLFLGIGPITNSGCTFSFSYMVSKKVSKRKSSSYPQ